MRYYAQYNDTGKLIIIGTGYGGTEITEAEYNALLAEIREKAALVDKLYSGEITIDEVPVEWREEIQRRVDERIAIPSSTEGSTKKFKIIVDDSETISATEVKQER